MDRVALINPPVPNGRVWVREGRCQQLDVWGASFPPLTLALISTQLEKNKVETLIIDSGPEGKNREMTVEEVKKFRPNLVVISTATPTINTDLDWFLDLLIKRLPTVKVAVVGIHVSTLPKETLEQFKLVDYVVIGEPEITITELATQTDLKMIGGLVYRDGDKIKINKLRSVVENIDGLGFPDWKKIDFKNYLMPIKGKPFLLINFSRGCPYNCKFCDAKVYGGKKIRTRKIEKVIEEIEYDISLGIKDFLFWTESMTGNNQYLDKFLDVLIEKELSKKIRWVCNSRVDSVDQKILEKMKKAGCWQIAFGFEFGDNEILKSAKKGTTVEQGRKTAELADKAGLLVDGHFILGYPGENEKTIRKTIDCACSMPLTFAHFYSAASFPGSEMFAEMSEDKKKIMNWQNISQVNRNVVGNFISMGYRSFYLRLKIICKVMTIPNNLIEFLGLVKIGWHFLMGEVW